MTNTTMTPTRAIEFLSWLLNNAEVPTETVDTLDLITATADALGTPDSDGYKQVMWAFDVCPQHRRDVEICLDDEATCQAVDQ